MSDPEGLPEALAKGIVIGAGFYKLDIGELSVSLTRYALRSLQLALPLPNTHPARR
jgi:hypothetical protein